MNIGTDYSYLLSGLSASNNTTQSSVGSMLSDYASIKNGSYYKLLKSYYAKNASGNEKTGSSATSKDASKTLAQIQTDTADLKKSSEALTTRGSKSLFAKKDVTTTDESGNKVTSYGYDTDSIYKAVKQFAEDYNSLLDSAGDSSSKGVLRQTLNMTNMTKSYAGLLGNAGITIGKDNKLSVDEDTFKKSDMNTVKTLFNGNASYAYNVAARASMIGISADTEAAKANTYTKNGGFGNPYSSGNIYSSFF